MKRKRAECRRASVVEDNIEKGTVDVHSAVVVQKAQLPELIQKETDA